MNQKEEEELQLMERLENFANIEEDREMGTVNEERVAHPIAGIGHISDKAKELHERISHLEDMLQPLLNPHIPGPEEKKDPSQPDSPLRSSLMNGIETADSNIADCIVYLSQVINRLDL